MTVGTARVSMASDDKAAEDVLTSTKLINYAVQIPEGLLERLKRMAFYERLVMAQIFRDSLSRAMDEAESEAVMVQMRDPDTGRRMTITKQPGEPWPALPEDVNKLPTGRPKG